jgi:hypothetical protein
MLDIYGYLTSWTIYLAAGTLCYILFYKATGRIRLKFIANSLRGMMIALIYTPWYVSETQDLMAPAVMVIPLDIITVGGDSFIRALVPLSLAVSAGIIAGLAWSLFRRKKN